jgi:7-keto-8-aminopelargonate synthetase-like enzyme
VDYLVNHARPYIYSTALAPPAAAAARRAVGLVAEEPDRRRRVLGLAERLCQEFRGLGYEVGTSRCQIVPLIVGEANPAVELSSRLEEHGLLVPAIRPSSVPEGSSRLRIGLTAGHTDEDVGRLVAALRGVRDRLAPEDVFGARE